MRNSFQRPPLHTYGELRGICEQQNGHMSRKYRRLHEKNYPVFQVGKAATGDDSGTGKINEVQ